MGGSLQQVEYNTAKTYLGTPDRKHQDWFDANDQELQTLMSKRDQSHRRVLQTMSIRSTTAAWKDACRLLQKRTLALKSDWWERKAVELQRGADIYDMRASTMDWRKCGDPRRRDLFIWNHQMEWKPFNHLQERWSNRLWELWRDLSSFNSRQDLRQDPRQQTIYPHNTRGSSGRHNVASELTGLPCTWYFVSDSYMKSDWAGQTTAYINCRLQ